jgi:hypothetical protein
MNADRRCTMMKPGGMEPRSPFTAPVKRFQIMVSPRGGRNEGRLRRRRSCSDRAWRLERVDRRRRDAEAVCERDGRGGREEWLALCGVKVCQKRKLMRDAKVKAQTWDVDDVFRTNAEGTRV